MEEYLQERAANRLSKEDAKRRSRECQSKWRKRKLELAAAGDPVALAVVEKRREMVRLSVAKHRLNKSTPPAPAAPATV